ncbi:potassium channel family protein [Loigolactobacillus coryniformis]|uniref:potassium channel family protein n=1 Tax=Loigolactobacillus coryniformis TaxID=1610 RepID=UPI003F1EEF8B
MISFWVLFRNMWHILRILFKQEEQKALTVAAALIFMVGTFFYHNVEKMSYLDALYFSVMTLATVGYGDLYPQTNLGKLFSIFYVLIGVGIITALIVNINHALTQYHREKRSGQG